MPQSSVGSSLRKALVALGEGGVRDAAIMLLRAEPVVRRALD